LALVVLVSAAGCGGKKAGVKKDGGKAEGSDTKSEEKAGTVSLAKDLMPVVERSCGVCHKREGGNEHAVENKAYFETKADILGRVGKYIIAGKPEESGLLKILDRTMKVGDHELVMPPPGKEVPPWSKEELEKFSTWIEEGAKDN
jgi:hypothetical protein